jgi:hypothetical protein
MKCIQIWKFHFIINHPTMSNTADTNRTPNDMKKRCYTLKELDPSDLNDAAFKLGIMFVFLLC